MSLPPLDLVCINFVAKKQSEMVADENRKTMIKMNSLLPLYDNLTFIIIISFNETVRLAMRLLQLPTLFDLEF